MPSTNPPSVQAILDKNYAAAAEKKGWDASEDLASAKSVKPINLRDGDRVLDPETGKVKFIVKGTPAVVVGIDTVTHGCTHRDLPAGENLLVVR